MNNLVIQGSKYRLSDTWVSEMGILSLARMVLCCDFSRETTFNIVSNLLVSIRKVGEGVGQEFIEVLTEVILETSRLQNEDKRRELGMYLVEANNRLLSIRSEFSFSDLVKKLRVYTKPRTRVVRYYI